MFDKAEARYALRCVLVGVSAVVAYLVANGFDAWAESLLAGASAALTYAGIGAALPQVEPFIGNKLEPPPKPPEGEA